MKKTPPSLAPAPLTKGPPSYKPKPKAVHPIEVAFAADPFDTRFVDKDRRLTPLGKLIQVWWYLTCELKDVCPDALRELEEMLSLPNPEALDVLLRSQGGKGR